MREKSITIGYNHLAYGEANRDSGPVIFFIHGNSSSHRIWLKQLSFSGLAAYRLIAFDLPAHGDSLPSPEPLRDYSLPELGRLLAEAVKILADDQPFILVGISFGTNCTAEMLAYDLHPKGIMLVGSSVFGTGITISDFVNPELDMSILFTDDGDGDVLYSFLSKSCFPEDKEDIRNLIDDYYRVAPPFRSSVIQTVMAGNYADEIGLLKSAGSQICIVFGERDNMVDIHYLDNAGIDLWRGKTQIIPGAGHLASLDQPEKFNTLLLGFVQERLPLAVG
jgi:pimeloyl-ACP methyl ester carboxylesterase